LLKRLWIIPTLAILAIALMAAACGGGGNNNTPTATRPAGTSTPAATATPRATASPAASPTRPAATATPKATATPAATAPPAATATQAATATPAAGATQIDVVAQGFAFDKKTIEVTAGQPFTIKLDNKDSAVHNLHIYTQKGGTSVAVTDPQAVSSGSTGTLTTTITQPGTYYFQCDFHPEQMNGTLTVK